MMPDLQRLIRLSQGSKSLPQGEQTDASRISIYLRKICCSFSITPHIHIPLPLCIYCKHLYLVYEKISNPLDHLNPAFQH